MIRECAESVKEKVLDDQILPDHLVYKMLYRPLLVPSIYISSRMNFGINLFDEEWDLLIILDSCRPDALRALAGEYDFINNVSEYWSVGGDSWEWMANTFDHHYLEIIQNVAYITSNPNSKTVLKNQLEKNHKDGDVVREKVKRLKKYGDFNLIPVDEFGKYESLYEHGIEQGHGMYPSPRMVTNRGIINDRKYDFERIILHYMPPHWPFIATITGDDTNRSDLPIDEKYLLKEEPRDRTFGAYLDNLRWGLDEVSLALENMSRQKVIITSDHGTSFSNRLPYHISGSLNPKVRRVPKVVTTARDYETHYPNSERKRTNNSPDEVLEALGYKM